jgi:outer membrane protease
MEHRKFHEHTQYKSKVISHLEWKNEVIISGDIVAKSNISWHLANLKRL